MFNKDFLEGRKTTGRTESQSKESNQHKFNLKQFAFFLIGGQPACKFLFYNEEK